MFTTEQIIDFLKDIKKGIKVINITVSRGSQKKPSIAGKPSTVGWEGGCPNKEAFSRFRELNASKKFENSPL